MCVCACVCPGSLSTCVVSVLCVPCACSKLKHCSLPSLQSCVCKCVNTLCLRTPCRCMYVVCVCVYTCVCLRTSAHVYVVCTNDLIWHVYVFVYMCTGVCAYNVVCVRQQSIVCVCVCYSIHLWQSVKGLHRSFSNKLNHSDTHLWIG